MEPFISLEQMYENADNQVQENLMNQSELENETDQYQYPGNSDPCDSYEPGPPPWTEKPEQMWFDKAMQVTLGGALEIATVRGGEYQDSWHEDNQQTPFGDFLRREVYGDTKVVKRLNMLAALCDVKLSRLAGGYKEDTFVDLINYIAAFSYALKTDIFTD